jgi:hypothetical protein
MILLEEILKKLLTENTILIPAVNIEIPYKSLINQRLQAKATCWIYVSSKKKYWG